MKRRGFLKALGAACLAPIAVAKLATTEPVKQAVSKYAPKAPPAWIRERKASFKAYQTQGCATLDNRNVLLCSFDGETEKTTEAIKHLMCKSKAAAHDCENTAKKLKDIFMSPDAMEDIRAWGVDTIDEKTRRELLLNGWRDDGYENTPLEMTGPLIIDGWGYDFDDNKESVSHEPHMAPLSIPKDFDREKLYELGRRGPYYKYIEFPVEITKEIKA